MGLIRFILSIMAAAFVARAVERVARRRTPPRARRPRADAKRPATPVRSDQVIDVPYEDVS